MLKINNKQIIKVLPTLLKDRTTGGNIVWATDSYADMGSSFRKDAQMFPNLSSMITSMLIPRIEKTKEQQKKRTKAKAEVFTPSWICNKMNNYCDEDWFEEKSLFNIENNDHTWSLNQNKIPFKKENDWKKYVDSRRIEITCGEAPFLVSRYDTTTGEKIEIKNRIGFLDRKLRVVNENTKTEEEWLKWTYRAFESTYGYEYQGDNTFLARLNLVETFIDYYKERFGKDPEDKMIQKIADIVSWNIWQMDGLTDKPPFVQKDGQMNFLQDIGLKEEKKSDFCRIKNWRSRKILEFREMKGEKKMKFDYCIGNPPYQNNSDTTEWDSPIYNKFMDAAYTISNKVVLITPARFLFNAGKTPKTWNEKMLNDKHFKVLEYSINSQDYFSNVDIKGGVAIHYRDINKDFGAIKTFTIYDSLNAILNKVKSTNPIGLDTIMYSAESYRFTSKLHEDFPQIKYQEDANGNNIGYLSKGHDFDIASNTFENLLNMVFFKSIPDNENKKDYMRIYGRNKEGRIYLWIKKEYIANDKNINHYKVFIPAANGSGALGEVLSTPVIGHNQTFISLGCFDTKNEAEHALLYIKTKFARALIGTLKVTQNGKKGVYANVPLQDFTSNSDIDWSKSIPEIDQQLYKKYNLSDDEINFIETHVKEMT